jgi:hypothetical protein
VVLRAVFVPEVVRSLRCERKDDGMTADRTALLRVIVISDCVCA